MTGIAGRASLELQSLRHLRQAGLIAADPPMRMARMARAFERYGAVGAAPALAALRQGERPGLADELGQLSFEELDLRSNALANGLRQSGVSAGDGVAILCRNHRGFADVTFACGKLGARALYLNTDFAAPQVTEVCAREGVDALVYDEEFAEVVAGVEARRGRFMAWVEQGGDDPTLEQLIAASSATPPPKPAVESRVVVLTSGTTGTPKGAPRENPRSLSGVGALLSKTPFRSAESTFDAPPMFHALGFAHLILAMGLGSTTVTRRRFDPEATIDAIERHRCTTLVVVPVMLSRILALGHEELGKRDLSSLRIIFCSGAQLEADLAIRAREAFGDVVYNLYGSTEVAYATIATPEDLRVAPGCAGKPPLGAIVRLFDDAGRPVEGANRTGRIFVGNGFQFSGYTGGGTKEEIDGLMSSGDVGHFDEAGRLFVDGRDDEMIVSGGENVFPREIEELLVSHEEVVEAALIGVDDEKFGKRLRAFVVRAEGSGLTEGDIQDLVKTNLARYKVPRDVVFIAELPRNPSGKVLKRELASV